MIQNWKKIAIMLVVIVIVIISILSFFAISSTINQSIKTSYDTGKNDGILYSVNTILTQLQQMGYATIAIGDQTLYLYTK